MDSSSTKPRTRKPLTGFQSVAGRWAVGGFLGGMVWFSATGQDSLLLQPFVLPAGATPGASQLGSFAINISPGSGLSGNSAALAAFNRAAAHWVSYFSDPITVTISADLTGGFSSANIIGQTSSSLLQGSYTTVRNAMVSDAVGSSFRAIDAFLPTSGQFSALLPGPIASVNYSLSGQVLMTKANAKALGFTGLDGLFGVTDSTIQFNNAFNFDYDNSNGVTPGAIDFETVAAHEIGHALGFISAVDNIDGSSAAFAVTPTTLDLFRFTNGGANDPTTSAQFTTAPRDLRPGSDVLFTDTVSSFRFSTGLTQGDGRQASHWKDDGLTGSYIGIMDPTLPAGLVEPINTADVKALALIGWNATVPEPSTWSATGAMVLFLANGAWRWHRARRNRSSQP